MAPLEPDRNHPETIRNIRKSLQETLMLIRKSHIAKVNTLQRTHVLDPMFLLTCLDWVSTSLVHRLLPKNALLLVAKKSDIIRLVCKAMAEGGRKPTKIWHHKACLQGQGGGRKEAKKKRHIKSGPNRAQIRKGYICVWLLQLNSHHDASPSSGATGKHFEFCCMSGWHHKQTSQSPGQAAAVSIICRKMCRRFFGEVP